MGKQSRRKEIEAKLEEKRYSKLLSSTKPRERARKKAKRDKRKTHENIKQHIGVGNLWKHKIIRRPEDWESKSYNLNKQIHDYLRHLFVIYPVPSFLYKAFDTKKPRLEYDVNMMWHRVEHYNFVPWFMALAQGESFHKLVKGVMTKREANIFLKSPEFDTIEESVWWAKLTVAGIQPRLIARVIKKFFVDRSIGGLTKRYEELIRFFYKFQDDIDKRTFDEITDFIANKFTNDPEFSLKGRTLGSVIRLSNDWHMLIHKAKVDTYSEWKPIDVPDWVFKDKEETIWKITQITNNIDLIEEGKKQRHCVYSYVRWCEEGRCFIFTMESSLEGKHLTLELDRGRRIVQARGRFNRSSTTYEKRVVRRWALDRHLHLAF
jgi:hypothetical protein